MSNLRCADHLVAQHLTLALHTEEHMARVAAEGAAVDYSRRLTVAQEQLAEYAAQKEGDSASHLSQAQSLEAMLKDLVQKSAEPSASAQLLSAAQSLCQTLSDEAGEAKNFAAQQKADVERNKRSSSMVCTFVPAPTPL